MELKKLSISKSDFMSIPEAERLFFLRFGNLFNEICILRKLVYFSGGTRTTHDILKKAKMSQAVFILRLLAGKLWEGWLSLRKDFFDAKISKDYEKKLTHVGKSGLSSLKKYFDKKNNNIRNIRNEISFHYSEEHKEHIKTIIDSHRAPEQFDVLISDNHLNCFYSTSGSVTDLTIIDWTNSPNDDEKSLQNLLSEIINITKSFLDFLGDCLFIIVKNHGHFDMVEVSIPNPPKFDEIELPYFIQIPEGEKENNESV
jgi:hypothetical protein